MSIFNRNKTERSVGNDEGKKRAIFRYFEILYRNFSKIVPLNFFYFLCILPLFVGVISAVCVLMGVSVETIESMFFVHLSVWITTAIPRPVFIVLFVLSLIAYGPLTAGLTHCVMNLVSGKHVFITDLFVRAKKNLKQGIAFGLLDMFVLFSVLLYISSNPAAASGGTFYFYQIAKIVAIIVAVVYFCMRFYTYAIAVKFELSVKDILKNSWIFFVLGFFRNILAIFVILFVLSTCISTPKIDIVLLGTVFFSVARFSASFATYHIIDEYMLKTANIKPYEDCDK